MAELVKDPTYRKFLETKPQLPLFARSQKLNTSPPWVVYVQKHPDGRWGKKEFWKYSEAFHFMKRWLRQGAHDATINCKRHGFPPPERLVKIKGRYVVGSDGVKRQATKYTRWIPKLEPEDPPHTWCIYCRRPVVFKIYSAHKRLGVVDPTVRRCCICGASERIALAPGERKL